MTSWIVEARDHSIDQSKKVIVPDSGGKVIRWVSARDPMFGCSGKIERRTFDHKPTEVLNRGFITALLSIFTEGHAVFSPLKPCGRHAQET
jgi:hypothetical protein